MAIPNAAVDQLRSPILPGAYPDNPRAYASAISWGAIVAGAAAAAALSLILLILGTGLGLSSVSPWAQQGVSATTFGVSTILWVTFTQIVASGMGGYIAGRLRSNWLGAQPDEIYFRDTAHGFLAWAVASLATATLLTSVIGSIVGNGMQAGATVAAGAASNSAAPASDTFMDPARRITGVGGAGPAAAAKTDPANEPLAYYVDSLFRKNAAAATAASASDVSERESTAARAEVNRIFMHTLRTGPLPADDLHYVGQLVAQRTGVSQDEAEKRVNDAYSRMQAKVQDAELTAKEAADKARKASAYTALWLFTSLLIGAFVASLAAIYGGRQRDL